MRRVTLTGLAVLAVAVLAATAWSGRVFVVDGPLTREVLLVVPSGAGLSEVAGLLAGEGVIRHRRVFEFGVRMRRAAREIRAGEYTFPAGASMAGVLVRLRSGEVHHRRLTLPEGITIQEAAAVLAAEPHLSGPLPPLPPEGSLAPDTYFFVRGSSRTGLLGRMAAAQQERLDTLWAERGPDLPYESPAEALVLASLVEKETGLDAERARIAGVFVNRLRRGMRLQSDPTVVYGLTGGSGALDRALRRKDLDRETPYNTYRILGLPPTPIALPGLASIRAALHPAGTAELYFVADGQGGHAFAETLEEHNRNVARWRRLRREAQDG